ncbi:phage shock protein C (PspC) family protein [Halopolyspora algeriensis]|uniref:Phage shock protein C (PspC) family protein n=1 Tax=Halopolyspora algeriensis TaxID=1500506 RepID=A0A368VXL2_9ACTN|nr:PspC domain-containing protein [Halopolyspora algeriensis]RCW46685.1 phage shock protein C (PspC) family protein [Halopolyspora algeriensis]TQM46710.1 phage shock protein C (PspC) family protein [Halopolyspora algeriensis]
MSRPNGHTTAGIEDTVRDFWANRPVRPRAGAKLGGVSAALGSRYGIDPVLVRVAFVVGTFYGGAGLVLYLLGWLLFPKEGTGKPGEVGSRSTSGPMLVLLVLLLVPALFAVADLAGLFGLVLGGLGLYLLHRHHRDRPSAPVAAQQREQGTTGEQSTAGEQATAGDANTWVYPGTNRSSTAGDTERTDPPSWDPLGAAPFAWDLPEPGEQSPEPEPPRTHRRSVTLITLALALLAGGLGVAIGMSPADAVAVGLAVLGAGMIVGAFVQGGRGLIGFAIPVAALAMLLSVLPTPWRGFTSEEVRPDTIGEVRDTYTGSVGNIELHLDDLRFADEQQLATSAHIGLGNISVYLPPNVDATVRCSTGGMGAVDCLGEQREGRDLRVETTDLGADGPGGGTIALDLTADTGNVEVFRG